MHLKYLLAIIVISSVVSSCRTTRPAATTSRSSGSSDEYIEAYKDMAVREMRRTGIPASITLAQGMIESGNGRSRLAAEANNHFGVKCHDDWNGPTIRHTDDRRNECFRKYRNPEESFRDHSDFLTGTPRYKFLFELSASDYKAWARGLKRAGYATNPDYANMLIRKIEEYELYRYDNYNAIAEKPVSNGKAKAEPADSRDTLTFEDRGIAAAAPAYFRTPPARVSENNRIQFITAGQGDTRKSIEKEFGLLSWELQRYNELGDDFEISPGQLLYLQPKREKAEPGSEFHIVKPGETMYLISQVYGVKLKSLYLMNRMQDGDEPAEGQKIWLRNIRPVE
jgi:LysM repeat protein